MRLAAKKWLGISLFSAGALALAVWAVSWPALSPFSSIPLERQRRIEARDQIERFVSALESFRKDNGFYPTTDQGLRALVERPKLPPSPRNYVREGYLGSPYLPVDPWGRTYVYESPSGRSSYSIVSRGKLAWFSGDDLSWPERGKVVGNPAE